MADKRIRIKQKSKQGAGTSGATPLKIKPKGEIKEKKEHRHPMGLLALAALSILVICLSIYLLTKGDGQEKTLVTEREKLSEEIDLSDLSNMDYHRIGKDEDLIDAMYQLAIDDKSIARILSKFREDVDPEDIPGSLIQLYASKMQPQQQILLFTPDPPLYQVTVGFGDTLYVKRENREIKTKHFRESHMVSYDQLYFSLYKDGFSLEFMQALEEVLEWSVDLHHIRANSKFRFKVLFDEAYADSVLISVSIGAIEFFENGRANHLYRFIDGDYYDRKGYSARKQFLRAPVKYSRVSSSYGFRRNPLSGQIQQHNGIDFAAPEGTPIRALSHGAIVNVDFTSGNGYYVKIRHDETYQTQYLHMSAFAENMKPGTSVKQGTVIGYVGSTGQSTGPHVCLRFWKNGQQVDFFAEEMPHLDRLSGNEYEKFAVIRDSLDVELQKILL